MGIVPDCAFVVVHMIFCQSDLGRSRVRRRAPASLSAGRFLLHLHAVRGKQFCCNDFDRLLFS